MSRLLVPSSCVVFLGCFLPSGLLAQRAFEANGRTVYEDAHGKRTDLGIGFSPVLTSDGRVALLRGRKFDYGDDFDCAEKNRRNWASIYDPESRTESVVFDGVIPFEGGTWNFCVFDQMQMSHDGSLLYLVSPVYATSGSLAIVNLPKRTIKYVPGVNEVYVIGRGPHRDELVYVRRVLHKAADGGEYPTYPFIHARANGEPIREISGEEFTVGGHDKVPILRRYLRHLGGTINVNGEMLP